MSSQSQNSIKIYNSISEFEQNLPKTVKILLTTNGSKIYLIGTSHFSRESQNDVAHVIRNVKPDFLVLELCKQRLHTLTDDEKTVKEELSNLSSQKINEIYEQHGFLGGFMYILFLKTNARLTDEVGCVPGGEFRRAYNEVREHVPNCSILLGDRDIDITIKRAVHGLTFVEKIFWIFNKFMSRHQKGHTKITTEDIENEKKLYLDNNPPEYAYPFSSLHRSLVTERDLFLTRSLEIAATSKILMNGKEKPVNVVGVVGIGHVDGIMKTWGKVDTKLLGEYLKIPRRPRIMTYAMKSLKLSIIACLLYGGYNLIDGRNKSKLTSL